MRVLFFSGLLVSAGAWAQTMSIEEYKPKSTLVVPAHLKPRAKFAFVDVHGHPRGLFSPDKIDQLVKEMDGLNMGAMVNLDGRSGDALKRNVDLAKSKYPDRFVVFCNLDFTGMDDPKWGAKAAAQLEKG